MKYRILDASEWDKLQTLIDPVFIPRPDSCAVAVAEDDDGTLLGCLFLQLTLHMEPIVLKSPKVNFERLHDTLYDAVKQDKGLRIYCFSDKEIIDRMAEHVGFKKLPWKIFEQEVK